MRRRVVDAADLAFLADLNLGGNRVDRRGGVVDVGDRAGRRDRLQVAVVNTVTCNVSLELCPLFRGRDGNVGSFKQCLHLVGLRLEVLRVIAVEELTTGVIGLLKVLERLALLHSNLVRRLDALVHHCSKVCVGEVEALLRAVLDVLTAQVAMQIHLAKADGMGSVVALAHARH